MKGTAIIGMTGPSHVKDRVNDIAIVDLTGPVIGRMIGLTIGDMISPEELPHTGEEATSGAEMVTKALPRHLV